MLFLRAYSKDLLKNHAIPPSSHHLRPFSSSSALKAVGYNHVIIGAGVVGLAIAHSLATKHPEASTLLLERHSSAGTETSSRNSEVIHAGLYYPVNSLKTRLCLRGKELLYPLCEAEGIRFRRTGKWIVAQDEPEMAELHKLHDHSRRIGVETRFLDKGEIRAREPDVRADAGVLESPTTGIVDSHALMAWLEGQFQDKGGDTVFNTDVTGLSYSADEGVFTVRTRSSSTHPASSTDDKITCTHLINSAGLHAIPTANLLLPPKLRLTPYYAKGTYFSYSAASPKPSTLIYPAPSPSHAGGLGTHLTLDLSRPARVRFGPDVEWVDSPDDLVPSKERLGAALDAIERYLPGIDRAEVSVDYCGMRPKVDLREGGWRDFVVRREDLGMLGGGGGGNEGRWVNLLGIESPGLTSALAIGEEVERLLYEH